MGFTFTPIFASGTKLTGVITHLLFEYLKSSGIIQRHELQAWDCSEAKYFENEGSFVRDEHRSVLFL